MYILKAMALVNVQITEQLPCCKSKLHYTAFMNKAETVNSMEVFQFALEEFHKISWVDAELEKIEFNYDNLVLRLQDGLKNDFTVICEGVVGFRLVRFWDEVVILSAELSLTGNFLTECLSQISTKIDCGSPARNKRTPMQINISLADGADLSIAMNGLMIVPCKPPIAYG